jgi:threonine/homoserine/homoserine lactone efflux protein
MTRLRARFLPPARAPRYDDMMPLPLYAAFAAATTILMLIPGPNVALIVANSLAHGARFGLLTVAGTTAAMIVQLALTALGMTALLGELARAFDVLRWIGVVYLLWLGVSAWRAPATDLTKTAPEPRSARSIFLRGFLVSLTNPKTLLFYAAFFPQFIDSNASLATQFALLSLTFLIIAIVVDSGWGLLAARFRNALAVDGRLRNRLTGGLLMGAGLGLALARRP